MSTGELVAIKRIFKGGMRSEQLKLFLKAVEVRFEPSCLASAALALVLLLSCV